MMRIKALTAITAIIAAAVLFSACVNTGPKIRADITPPPSARVTEAVPDQSSEPADGEATALPAGTDPTPIPADIPDVTGTEGPEAAENGIDSDHFERYLTFRTMLVYEEDTDTFLDGIVRNDYSKAITCAVDIVYYDDDGVEITRARLQTRDGKYLLVLEPGETVVYARILTDMTLTDREYSMEFDMDIGIKPVG